MRKYKLKDGYKLGQLNNGNGETHIFVQKDGETTKTVVASFKNGLYSIFNTNDHAKLVYEAKDLSTIFASVDGTISEDNYDLVKDSLFAPYLEEVVE